MITIVDGEDLNYVLAMKYKMYTYQILFYISESPIHSSSDFFGRERTVVQFGFLLLTPDTRVSFHVFCLCLQICILNEQKHFDHSLLWEDERPWERGWPIRCFLNQVFSHETTLMRFLLICAFF